MFLPSGMAVRLTEDKSQAGKKGGKRKRSISKSIEIFPKGVPILSPNGRRESVSSPPRKITSPLSPVHQAGHGYARPPPSAPCAATSPAMSPPKITEAQLFSPPKRGPGRPPGSSSPNVGRGQGAVRTRAPRASRPRGPRSRGRGLRASVPLLHNVPVSITQSPLVQGPTGQSMFTPVHPGARPFRTSTPKLSGLAHKQGYSQLNSVPLSSAGLVGLTQVLSQTYPQDLSTTSSEAKPNLQNFSQSNIGYLQAQNLSSHDFSTLASQGGSQLTSLSVPQLSGLTQIPAQFTQSREQFSTPVLTTLPSQGAQTNHTLHLSNSGSSNPSLHLSNQSFSHFSSSGLKVISHSGAKIVPKAGGTVYVVPGNTQRLLSPAPRLVTVTSGTPRLATIASTPGVSSVIRTIRTSSFPGSNKSVIVVQKSGPTSIRGSRPSTVALYRPARGGIPVSRGISSGMVRLPSFPRPTLIRQQSANGNLYLVELGQDSNHQQTMLPNSLMTSEPGAPTLQRIISKPISSSKPMPIVISSSSQTLSKKILHDGGGNPEHEPETWFQAKDIPGANPKPTPDTTRSSVKTGLSELEDGNMTKYSDIFSLALEQANIPLENNIAPESYKSLSSSTGRFVTLPARGNSVQLLKNESLVPVSGSLVSNSGTLVHTYGSLVQNSSSLVSGTLLSNSGTLVQNSGILISKSGSLVPNSGTLMSNSGILVSNSGSLVPVSGSVAPISENQPKSIPDAQSLPNIAMNEIMQENILDSPS